MRIEELRIDRFGRLQDKRFRLASGLNVLYGPNEAGKSTLLAFVRGMLFGFPKSSKRAEDYPGIEPGWGGTMTLRDDRGGRWLMARSGGGASQLRFEDGSAHDARQLAGMWSGLNGETYRQLFAIRLDELQEVGALQSDEIGAFLFHAGMGPGGREVLKAERALTNELERLYRRKGKVQDLNRLLKEWEDTGKELRKWELEAGRYIALEREQAVMAAEIGQLEAKQAALAERLAWVQLRRKARPIWQERTVLRREAESIETDESIAVQAAELETFAEAWKQYVESRREHRELELEHEALNAQLAPVLRQFSDGWDRRRLLEFAESAGDRDTVREYAERRKELRSKEERLRTEEELAEQELQSLERAGARDAEAVASLMEAAGIPAGDWRSGEGEPLGAALRQLADLQAAHADTSRRLQDLNAQQDDLSAAGRNGGRWYAYGLGAAIFAFGAWKLLEQDWMTAAVGIAASAVVALLAARGPRSEAGQLAKRLDARKQQLEAELAEQQRRMAEVWRRLQSGRRGEAAATADPEQSGSSAPAEEALARLIAELDRYEQARAERGRMLQRAEDKRLQLVTSLRFAQERQEELQRQWRRWLDERGMNPALTPDSVMGLFPAAERGRELMERIDRSARRLTARREAEARMLAEAERRCGSRDVQDVSAKLAAERERLEREQERLERRRRMTEQAAQLEAQIWALAGPDAFGPLMEALESDAEERLELEHRACLEEQSRLKRDIGSLQEERGKIASQLERLRSDDDMARLRQKQADLKEAVLETAQTWAEHALSLELIQRTRAVYERERQPDVLKRASSYFATLTGGRFRQILVPFGEKQLTAVRENGEQLSADMLSRGTREQLYLAIRFALVDAYAQRESLPIVLDDIFVNFDDERFEYARQTVRQLAERHQVILFTCHERVRDSWTSMADSVIPL